MNKMKMGNWSKQCPACDKKINPDDDVTLINLGPGDDPEEQKDCLEGRPYCAVTVPVHWACATGEVEAK